MGIWEGVKGGKGRGNDVNIISKIKENNVKKSCILEVRHIVKQPSKANCLVSWDDLS